MSISEPPIEMAFHFITFDQPEDVNGFTIKPAGMLLVQENPLFGVSGFKKQKEEEWNGIRLGMRFYFYNECDKKKKNTVLCHCWLGLQGKCTPI